MIPKDITVDRLFGKGECVLCAIFFELLYDRIRSILKPRFSEIALLKTNNMNVLSILSYNNHL